MVAVNETFFVADVRRFYLANALEKRATRTELTREKNVENRRYLVVARRVGKPTFRVFSSTEIRRRNGKRRRLDRRRDDDSASARRAGNRRAVVKQSPDVGAERFIVNLRKRVQLFLQKCKNFAFTLVLRTTEPRFRTTRLLFLYFFRHLSPTSAPFLVAFERF